MTTIMKIASLAAGFMISCFPAIAGERLFSVLPWNGHTAAVSLTFDDGDPIHLDFAIPEMNKRGIRGTFFLFPGSLTRQDEWKHVAADGMEIGNHSMNHKHANELSAEDEVEEVDNAGIKLKELSGQPVVTYAYPFVEITDTLRARVEKNCIAARGGGPGVFYYTPDTEADWMNIHSQATMTDYGPDVYKGWIDQALDAGAWTVFMVHAIEGSNWWQPIPKDTFTGILDRLQEDKDGIWAAPFGEVAAYWQAQLAIEGEKPVRTKSGYLLKWKKPAVFPTGVTVKVKAPGMALSQAGKALVADGQGIYEVLFDAGELTLEKTAAKKIK